MRLLIVGTVRSTVAFGYLVGVFVVAPRRAYSLSVLVIGLTFLAIERATPTEDLQ